MKGGNTEELYQKRVTKAKDYFDDLRKTLNDELDKVEKHILDDYAKKKDCGKDILE